MRGKTVSFDEAIQLKTLIYRIFFNYFYWIATLPTFARNDD
ncbi:hypothetical protein [Rickettsia felis]|nr:hypothetical protein [Rickettsia felis]